MLPTETTKEYEHPHPNQKEPKQKQQHKKQERQFFHKINFLAQTYQMVLWCSGNIRGSDSRAPSSILGRTFPPFFFYAKNSYSISLCCFIGPLFFGSDFDFNFFNFVKKKLKKENQERNERKK